MMQDTSAYMLTIQLSAEDLDVLHKFAHSKDGSIQDAHQIMRNMVKDVYLHPDYQPETWSMLIYDFLKMHLSVLLQVSFFFLFFFALVSSNVGDLIKTKTVAVIL